MILRSAVSYKHSQSNLISALSTRLGKLPYSRSLSSGSALSVFSSSATVREKQSTCCKRLGAKFGGRFTVRSMATEVEKQGGNAAQNHLPIAEEMLEFINKSATQFHAVEEAAKILVAAGFKPLSEREPWKLEKSGRYFFTRNLSTLVAFAVGSEFKTGNGFHMIGAHTDSPCLKLKPVSKGSRHGFLMVNVEPYGGGLWHTWFDRDLTVAGRVLVKKDGKMIHRLVKIDRPIMRVPMLAIHLNRDIHDQGFKPNKQTHVVPILATALKEAASGTPQNGSNSQGEASKHHELLVRLLAEEIGAQPEDIVDFELNVCDTQDGCIGGAHKEFVFVGRLDNLAMSFCSLKALADTYCSAEKLSGSEQVSAIALFDHEEVGSSSAQGAGGPVMRDTITRVTQAFAEGSEEGSIQRALQKSLLVSADMAHAHHPNYADKHEPDHKPQLHKGLVLKHNVNQRYATDSVTATLFREVGKRRGIPCQEFCVRSDMGCGSTIGPILASGLGCRTVDVGAPSLSMHSIREMCGVDDIGFSYQHFVAFFEDFAEIDGKLLDLQPEILGTITDTPCNHVH